MLMDTQAISTHSYPLSLASDGDWVRVINISGGKHLLRRLLAMGITDGCELEVIHTDHENGIVVRYEETRWAIGKAMAHKVLVSPIIKDVQQMTEDKE